MENLMYFDRFSRGPVEIVPEDTLSEGVTPGRWLGRVDGIRVPSPLDESFTIGVYGTTSERSLRRFYSSFPDETPGLS